MFYDGNKGCEMMSQPNVSTKAPEFQKIYFFISLGLLALSIIMFGLGVFYAQTPYVTPQAIIDFASYVTTYHYIHLGAGIILIIVVIRENKKKLLKTRVWKTIIGMILTPLSGVVLLAAVILLGLSSCA